MRKGEETMSNMTETEIQNFALNFSNLIRNKNNEIAELKSENSRLRATVKKLAEPGRKLTEKEVREGNMPVYCLHMKRKLGFWAVPIKDRTGVISNTKGVYQYSDYGKTWCALSAQPD